jgi:hypothetical protein
MNNKNMKQTVLSIVGLSIVILVAINGVSTVHAELNTNDFQYTVHITDIIPYYTYHGVSNFLSNNQQSFEDIDVFRFIIQDSNYYAVYNNDDSGNFVFSGIFENGA